MTRNHPDIAARLEALPQKIAVPFRQLLVAGQLNEEVLSDVLDAGELSGDTCRLVAFAAGYVHLRSQGIPVHDVIRMAKDQKRRINLAWSAKRWMSEHDRLSHFETLARLSGENTAYDVSRFEALLPAKFPGYLIRTSRRLGMEGFRQRHCVASYHDKLLAGSCAIIAVFAGRKRWTVQLIATSETDAPLRIAQVKSRLNELPSEETRRQIHAMLGIEQPKPISGQASPASQRFLYMDNLRRVLPVLREHQVRGVAVAFEGSGDSGAIDYIHYDAPEGFDAGAVTVSYLATQSHFDDGQWIRSSATEDISLDDAIRNLTDEYLEEAGVDWYNNDGGFGELVIGVEEGTVELEISVRYTESNTEFHSERDIATGEEVG